MRSTICCSRVISSSRSVVRPSTVCCSAVTSSSRSARPTAKPSWRANRTSAGSCFRRPSISTSGFSSAARRKDGRRSSEGPSCSPRSATPVRPRFLAHRHAVQVYGTRSPPATASLSEYRLLSQAVSEALDLSEQPGPLQCSPTSSELGYSVYQTVFGWIPVPLSNPSVAVRLLLSDCRGVSLQRKWSNSGNLGGKQAVCLSTSFTTRS